MSWRPLQNDVHLCVICYSCYTTAYGAILYAEREKGSAIALLVGRVLSHLPLLCPIDNVMRSYNINLTRGNLVLHTDSIHIGYA